MSAPIIAMPFSAVGTLVAPTLPSLYLSDTERDLVAALQRKRFEQAAALLLLDAYYNGQQEMTTLGISLPPELEGLRTALGWPRIAVDLLHECLDVEGFRFPDADDVDEGLWEIWLRNDLDTEVPMGLLDALVLGLSYLAVGTDDDLDVPLVTVESPFNMTDRWDARRRAVSSAMQVHADEDGNSFTTLWLPDQTIELAADERRKLEVTGRDRHRLGRVPVLRMANRSRVHDRGGRSEITPELRTVTNSAIRGLLRMEVGAEFFSTPQRAILGATEQAFQDAEGNPKSVWETYIGRILALERDEDGNVPEIHQFNPGDPSAHTKVLDKYAEIAAGIIGVDASYLGKTTDNPASADAIRLKTDQRVQKARRRQKNFTAPLRGAMNFARAFQADDTDLAAEMLDVLWRPPEIPTPAATTDAITKQIDAEVVPPDSDVVLTRLNYSAVERRQLARDRQRHQADRTAQALLARATAQTAETADQAARPAPPGAQERAQGDQQAGGAAPE